MLSEIHVSIIAAQSRWLLHHVYVFTRWRYRKNLKRGNLWIRLTATGTVKMDFWPKKTGRWPGFGVIVHWRVLTVKMWSGNWFCDRKLRSTSHSGDHRDRVSLYTALYTTYSHVLDGEIKAIAANWCLIVRTWGNTPAALIVWPTLGRWHQHVAQCCRNIHPSFRKCLGIQKVCLGFKRIHRNIDKKYIFENLKNLKINKLWSGGYTTSLQK